MPQVLNERAARSAATTPNLAKAMADAAYQVGIHAADITGHVEDITRRIADQTELLSAATASIEAMTRSNADIENAVVDLRGDADRVTQRMQAASGAVADALEEALAVVGATVTKPEERHALATAIARIGRATGAFDEVARLRDKVLRQMAAIAEATARNRAHCEDIFEEITQVGEAEQASKTDTENVAQMCLQLSDLSAELYYTIIASGVETADTPFITAVMETAAKVTTVLDSAVDNGDIDLDTLFDEDYQRMPGIEPPKYTTRWLPLIEHLIPPIVEPMSTITPDVVLCTITDRNGYMPINNIRHSHPPTNDPVWNATYSRHRIRHHDRISDRINKSTKPFLVMVFRRRLGDRTQVLRDVSAPVFIKGRLWGNVRMLILIKVETVDYILKQMDIHRAIDRLRRAAPIEPPPAAGPDPAHHALPRKFCVHHAGRLVILDNSQIQIFFARDRLVFIQTEDGSQYPIRSTLSELEEKLDKNQFMRCHRNFIVNINHVEYLNNWFNRGYILTLKGPSKTEVPVSRIFVKHLKQYIEFE
jgi:methyl-accepting chemotaxis protein